MKSLVWRQGDVGAGEALYDRPLRAMPVAHVVFDADAHVVRFNDLAAQALGLTDQHVGQALPAFASLVRDVQASGEPLSCRLAHHTVQAAPLATGVLLTLTDAAAPDQALRELNQMLNVLPMMPFVIEADGTTSFYGAQWSRFLGVPLSDVFRTTLLPYVHPADRELARHVRFTTMHNGEAVRASFRWLRHDGEYRWLSTLSVPLTDASGNVIKHFGCCVDVHEEVQLRQQLQATLHSLDQSHPSGRVSSWTLHISRNEHGELNSTSMQSSEAAWELLAPLLGPEYPHLERMMSCIHAEDRAPVIAKRDAAVRALRPLELIFRTNPDAGPVRWLLARGVPILDEHNRCNLYAGMLVEFTKEMEAEKAREETARRLEHATKIARVGFFERDLLTGLGWNDEQAARYLGLPPGPCPNDAVWARLDPSEASRVAQTKLQAHEGQAREFEAVHKYLIDGKPRWLRVRAEFDYLPDGRASRMVGSYIDVSELYAARERVERQRDEAEQLVEQRTDELRRQELHMEAILEGVPCALAYWDGTSALRFANRAFLEWFGVKNRDVAFASLWNARHRDPIDERLERAHRGEAQSFEVATLEETPRWAHAYLLPDVVPNEPDGLLLLLVDISELKGAEWRADEATRAKGQFLANMSHEIRTPLTAVVGFAELGARAGEGRNGELFTRILAAGRHLLGLIDDVLDFSRIEAGKLEIKNVEVDLGSVEAHLLDSFARVAAEKKVLLCLREGKGLPRKVRSDGGRITQLLINLVSNALKFTSQGHVRVTLDYDRGALTLVVEDTGAGIPEDTQRRLFQPFEQGVQRGGPQAAGTGLGLAICKRIVGLMAGTLELESAVDVGTTVRVRLPCTVLEDAKLEALQRVRLLGLPVPQRDELLAAFRMRGLSPEIGADGLDAQVVLTTSEQLPDLARAPWRGRVVVLGDHLSALPPSLARRTLVTGELTAPLALQALLEQAHPVPEELPDAGPLAGVRVLAVEDNAINRALLGAMLEQTRASLVCEENGERALARIAADGASAYDIVLCDVQMPGIDGYETTRRINALAPQLPVIGLSADAYEDARRRGATAGMVGFLTKPYDLASLVRVIAQHAARRRGSQASVTP